MAIDFSNKPLTKKKSTIASIHVRYRIDQTGCREGLQQSRFRPEHLTRHDARRPLPQHLPLERSRKTCRFESEIDAAREATRIHREPAPVLLKCGTVNCFSLSSRKEIFFFF